MIQAPLPTDEAQRLDALRSLQILDTDREQHFDDLATLAAQVCETPIGLVSLVDEARQWFKAHQGLDARETPREHAFCAHAILAPRDMFVVRDAFADERFFDNPLVTGEPRVRFYAGVPICDENDFPMGTLCVIDHDPRDLTEQQLGVLRALARQVEAQLQLRMRCIELADANSQLQRVGYDLDRFSTLAAHDLQEPLRQLVSFADLLREDLGDALSAEVESDVHHMVDASLRMRDLIRDFLLRCCASSRGLEHTTVDLKDCVHDALQALSATIESTGTKVTVPELPSVEGDRALLTQMFLHLIDNALKFVREQPPEVTITCAERAGETVLGVRDNGIGIDEASTETVFELFRRLHPRWEFGGTGIGLSIVQTAVERHGGRIWIESAPGGGSHFRFVLPGSSA